MVRTSILFFKELNISDVSSAILRKHIIPLIEKKSKIEMISYYDCSGLSANAAPITRAYNQSVYSLMKAYGLDRKVNLYATGLGQSTLLNNQNLPEEKMYGRCVVFTLWNSK